VIGASGFVGRHILAAAGAAGYDAVGTRANSGAGHLIHFDLLRHRIEDCLGLEAGAGGGHGSVCAVICACISQIDRCYQDRSVSRAVNVEKTILMISDLIRHGIKPVFLSSSFVHDGRLGYYTEDQPCLPICEYGRHKAEVEKYLIRSGSRALVFRLDKVIGDNPDEPHLFTQWQACSEQEKPIQCIEGQLFSPTHVKDVARAVIMGCRQDLEGIYNLANTEYFTRMELAAQFVYMMGYSLEISANTQDELNFKDHRPLKTYLDASRIIQETDIRFTSMRKTISEFKKRIINRHGS